MKVLSKHEGVCGIYGIRNLTTNKIYIGKSLNIRQRVYNHISGLNSKDLKRENQYFINAWWKYGKNDFEYIILEIVDRSENDLEEILKTKELFWMDFYKSTNENFGYNLRRDSSTKMIIHEKTRKKLSKAQKKRYLDINERIKTGEKSSKFWKNNPDIKKQMSEKVSKALTKYHIYQYSKDGKILIKKWERLIDIINENPNYKKHNIYAVCSGEKPSMYGYKWVKVLIDDIVQPNGDISE